jgi:hypothetical protein
MKKPENPFLTIGYLSPEYFCDRELEYNLLRNNLLNGLNTTLTSQRRIGKTGLIKHLFYQLPENRKGVYVDILATENLSQFLNQLTTSIISSIPEKSGLGSKLWKFIKSMRPVLSFDPLTGLPQASFDFKPKETEIHINTLFQFLEKQEASFIIAIDEFQQIINYPEKNAIAWLRSIIQQLNNVRFIFAGSQQHIIDELFNDPANPFFRSSVMMSLSKIPHEKYVNFISEFFTDGKMTISHDTISQMLEWSSLHTYYVQLLCNRVYSAGKAVITETIWKNEAFKLIKEQEHIFFNYRSMLTTPQWKLLKAVASDGIVHSPTSSEFVSKHKLGNPSTVLRSMKSLMQKQLVYSAFNDQGLIYYSLYDILFHRWAESVS